MIVESIKLKNYQSLKDIELENLKNNWLYIITADENGAGKSSIIEGIVYSIYGKTVRPSLKSVKDIINFNSKYLQTQIKLNNNIFIERNLYRKKSKTNYPEVIFNNNGYILSSDKIDEQLEYHVANKTDINNSIENTLIPFNIFSLVHYFNPQNLIFFMLQPKYRYNIIEDLLNIHELDNILEEYKTVEYNVNRLINFYEKKINDIENSITVNENKITMIDNLIEKYNNQKEELKKKYEVFIKNSIKDVIEKLSFIKNFSTETSLREIRKELNDKKKELENILNTIKSIDNLEENYQKYKTQYEKYLTLKIKCEEINKLLSDYKKDKGICPLCRQPLNNMTEDKFVEHINNILNSNISSIKDYLDRYKKLINKIDEFKNKITQIERTRELYYSLNDNINKLELKFKNEENKKVELYNELINNLQILEDKIPGFVFLIEDKLDEFILSKLEYNKNEPDVGKLIEQQLTQPDISEKEKIFKEINNLIEEKEKIQERLKEIYQLKEYVNIVIKELNYNGEYRNLYIKHYIEQVESILNDIIKYLIDVDIKLSVQETGKDKGIIATIIDNNKEKSYGQLSTGERRLVDIGALITFSTFSEGVLLLDESLDSLTINNQMKVLDFLLSLERQIFLITQNVALLEELDYNIKNYDIIKIFKKDGESIIL